jgi:ABC-2 type transport system ATP-binding protein
MRQRIKVAQAIVHDPDVLVFDEPLNGLDPVGRAIFRSDDRFRQSRKVRSGVIAHSLRSGQVTERILVIYRGR